MKKILIIAFFIPTVCASQGLPTVFDETELQFKVKQIDEFFRRFNFEETYDGSKAVDKNDSSYTDMRLKNMATLFNLEKFKGENDILDSTALSLCNHVMEHNKKIDYKDSTWTAEAMCAITYNQKKYPLSIYLKPEQIKGDYYKWVIMDVSSPLFNEPQICSDDSLFLSPAEHGISFITIPEMINKHIKGVRTLSSRMYKYSSLSVFNFLVSHNLLKLSLINSVKFHFKIDNYSFIVERLEKENTYNKGWLINHIEIQ
ncbi:MAG: hypothetical protein J6I52_03180 [Prevotella sp.]|nr:hypothetical protein [Prevotella sp.]MBP3842443.1 hypothetical protein [Prevotella sp.]